MAHHGPAQCQAQLHTAPRQCPEGFLHHLAGLCGSLPSSLREQTGRVGCQVFTAVSVGSWDALWNKQSFFAGKYVLIPFCPVYP